MALLSVENVSKSFDGETIPEGAVVTAEKIEGVTLIVKIKELTEA